MSASFPRWPAVVLAGLAGCSANPANEGTSEPAVRHTAAKPAEITTVELKAVRYAQLVEAVRAQKGKVVVVDVWASWCLPCKKEFPHLVELHRAHAGKGLVCISVSVDEAETAGPALEFLKKQKATFANYRLDEEAGFWAERWDVKAIPIVFVFDRDGKRAAKFTLDDPDRQFDYQKDVNPLVNKLLAKK
jgi:thiol-disulfide isomerase/thioredoxin